MASNTQIGTYQQVPYTNDHATDYYDEWFNITTKNVILDNVVYKDGQFIDDKRRWLDENPCTNSRQVSVT
jgi:hypothetical protein